MSLAGNAPLLVVGAVLTCLGTGTGLWTAAFFGGEFGCPLVLLAVESAAGGPAGAAAVLGPASALLAAGADGLTGDRSSGPLSGRTAMTPPWNGRRAVAAVPGQRHASSRLARPLPPPSSVSVAPTSAAFCRSQMCAASWACTGCHPIASRGTRVLPGDVLGSGTCGNGGCLAELWGVRGRQIRHR